MVWYNIINYLDVTRMNEIFIGTLQWIKDDYKTNPFRFGIELLAWAISIGCSVTMALTVPNPPLIMLYPVWITGCALYAWAAYTRKSFGMLANYVLLTTIDTIGLLRMVM
jgi:hypothetical protein